MDARRLNILKIVHDIIDDVFNKGEEAIIKYTKKFDNYDLNSKTIEVKAEEWKTESEKVSAEMRVIIQKAADNIKFYSEAQLKKINQQYKIENKGIIIEDKMIPIDRVGIYVPGGEYPYPSTVLMCAVVAKAAGVENIIMVTPPANLTPEVLAAAEIAGVDRIFRVGGVQAIAAMAFGKSVPKVDKIVGPGNSYVQYAKMMLSDIVGIDMIAGPSEVVVISDEFQDPQLIATDLLSQAEHSGDALAKFYTNSEEIYNNVKKLIPAKLSDRVYFEKVDSLEAAALASNLLAPEHLELMCSEENLKIVKPLIKNAGAVFVGPDTPVAVGDYWAGPSHTLPTGRAARYSEGLNVRSFLKKVSFIACSKEAVKRDYPLIAKFAEAEGMQYHAESVKKRQ